MLDPGTALAVVGLVLDVTKDLYEYYTIWKGRDEDIAEARIGLLWLNRLFVAIRLTLMDIKLAPDHEAMICQSIESCRGVINKFEKRLDKSKKEGTPTALMQKMGDQARRMLYPFQRGTIVRLAENIEDCKQRLHLVISLVNMDTTAKGLQELRSLDRKVTSAAAAIDAIHKLVIEDHREEDKQKILDWLRPVDQSDLHAAAIRKHEPGTSEWFLSGTYFDRWKQQPGSLLWMYGSAGCGKTVLFSSIVTRLENASLLQLGQHSLAYFYCLYRKGARHTLAAILQTFIAQLCPRTRVPAALRQLYELHNKKFPPGVPSVSELKATLLSIVRNSTSPGDPPGEHSEIFLLIDALDEWPIGSERDELLSYLAELAACGISHLHILVTSRDESDIRDVLVELHPWTNLSISKDRVSADMRLYISNEIEKHPRLSQKSLEIKSQIMQRLVAEGNGMFRWAALQLEAIKRLRPMNPHAIIKTLHSLPKDLDETYDSILSKVTEETLTALRWIAFATRPLLIEELIDACAIKYSESSNIDQQFDCQNKFAPSDILDLLPGLIAIDPPLQGFESFLPGVHIVTFAHFSVQEYLLGERIKSGLAKMYSLELRLSNHALARDCLAYLRCSNSFSLRTATYPLRGYAWDYWAWHAQFENSKPHEQIGTDAQALFKSISYQKLADGETSFDHLLLLLSDVAVWYAMTRSAKLELLDCLRIPFFYNEFNISTWPSSSNSSPRQYEYQPLRLDRQEIRLVELFPSPKAFTEIRCKMFTVSLDDKPQFDALSYVWGDPLRVGYIRMDGLLLQIPTNLIDVLRNFRGKGNKDKRVLFADAICFDRHVVPEEKLTFEDMRHLTSPGMSSERETRFQLNPRIFKAAQQVAIGLGERDDADFKAIEFVREITSKPIEDSKDGQDGQESEVPPIPSYDAELGPSILRLFQRKWWLRSWPIQELILPLKATLYYGDMAVTFEIFQKFFQMENELQKYLHADSYDMLVTNKAWIGAKRVSMIRSDYAKGRIPMLPELLWATQLHEARKIRDKIYALLGLFSLEQEESERLIIRYSSDMDLFTQIATYILARNATIDILSYASCHPFQNSKSKDYCPTWVPNFAIAQTTPPLICGSFGPHEHEDLYNAGRQHGPPELEVSKDSKSLQVKGFRIDIIEVLCDTFAGETNADVLDRYTSLVQVRSNMKLPSGQSALEAYWRSIHLDQWEGRRLMGDFQALIKNHPFILERSIEHAQANDLFDLQYCKGRRLFLTPLGYIGLGPAHLRVGDLITVLPGGKVPYILRNHEDNYTLVGEGYVHGIMDGEVMKAFQNGEYKLNKFCLI